MTNPSNCPSCKRLFRNVDFPEIFWYNRYLTAGIRLHIQIEIIDFKLWHNVFFLLFSFFLHSLFCFLLQRRPYWFRFLQLFQRFPFWICILLENGSFLSNYTSFPKCWVFLLFYFVFTFTIQTFFFTFIACKYRRQLARRVDFYHSYIHFCINSCYIKSMQVFKDICPIFSCSIILYRCDASYIPSNN